VSEPGADSGSAGSAGSGAWPGTGTAVIWRRLRRPLDHAVALDALLGLSPSVTRQLVGEVLATSAEAEELLHDLPHVVRSLAVATTMSPVRTVGEVRGPVLWSETIAARAASPGAGGVFVCNSPSKAFDTDENRVLVAALRHVELAARDAEHAASRGSGDVVTRRARANGALAVRYLEHRTLASVARTKPTGRSLRRARSGTRRATYVPAVTLIARAAEPLTVDYVVRHCDARTRAQHDLLAALVDGLGARGLHLPRFLVEHGEVRAGPVTYIHSRFRGTDERVHGIVVDRLVIDVPDRLDDHNRARAEGILAARTAGRPALLVQSPADIPTAVKVAARVLGV
jgi:hypothetical protein